MKKEISFQQQIELKKWALELTMQTILQTQDIVIKYADDMVNYINKGIIPPKS